MARQGIRALNDRRPSVRKSLPTWAFMIRADDGNRTRTVSLGICTVWACMSADLRRDQSASDRETPLITGVNGPLMARLARPGPCQFMSLRSSSSSSDLRITRVFPCVARRFKPCVSFGSTACRWWRVLARDGRSGASRGHGPGGRRLRQRSTLLSDGFCQVWPQAIPEGREALLGSRRHPSLTGG
jgi:hypothetical protein